MVCDGFGKYEEAEVHRLGAVSKKKQKTATDRLEYSKQPALPFGLPNGPVTLSPFALRSAEREQNEEKRIKNGMDVVHTEYNRIRTGNDGMVV